VMRKIPILFLISVMLCVPMIVACPGGGGKSFVEQSPTERATWMMGIYNSQYRDYMNVVSQPNLSDTQKDILKTKKQILTELYPLIGVYADMVAADPSIPPDRETEDKILALINRLLVK
jgi:hypothetical protein